MNKQEAIQHLQELLKPGDTVYTVLRHVSRSGMYRRLDLYIIRDDQPQRITYAVAKATGSRYDEKHESLGVSGCGMDMGFAVVYDLSRVMFPDGFGCIGERCPSNDHSNGDRDFTMDGLPRKDPEGNETVAHWHRSGGYALRHKWM